MLKTIDFEKTPVVEAVNDILVDASKMGASDIHFDPLEQYMKVRIRIDGMLQDYVEVPNSIKKNLITRIKIISGMNITESRLPQDGAIKATIKNINLDLRVSSIPTVEGEKIVIRLLDYSMSNSGLENLGFSDVNLKKVMQMINVPNGIVLITGATGSGKSTTVYSILHKLNKEETNIITVEDPIEMNIAGINQIQTNSEIGLDFATALRSILRQDPNFIMIGEIRDTETAKIAVRASITGHLVLSTIHTNDSLNTIERLLDMEVERYLLSSALTGIISQKLARRLCPHCRVKRPTSQYEKDIFRRVLGREVNEIYSTGGCDECGNGYSGRIAIHEVLVINQAIKDAISENMRKEELRELVYNSDVITLLQDGLEKVEQGLTTFEELLKLIELEDDEKLANTYSLKKALNYTEIANNAAKVENKQVQSDPFSMSNVMNEIDNASNEQDTVVNNEVLPNNVYETENNVHEPEVSSEVTPEAQVNSQENVNTTFNNIDNVNLNSNLQEPISYNNNMNVDNYSSSTVDNHTDSNNLGINDVINNINKVDNVSESNTESDKKTSSFGSITDILNNLNKK